MDGVVSFGIKEEDGEVLWMAVSLPALFSSHRSAEAFSPGLYKLKWRLVAPAGNLTSRDDKIEIIRNDGGLVIDKAATPPHVDGRPSPLAIQDGVVRFNGAYCDEEDLVFTGGFLENGDVAGMVAGETANRLLAEDGKLDIAWGTFLLSKSE